MGVKIVGPFDTSTDIEFDLSNRMNLFGRYGSINKAKLALTLLE